MGEREKTTGIGVRRNKIQCDRFDLPTEIDRLNEERKIITEANKKSADRMVLDDLISAPLKGRRFIILKTNKKQES